MTTVDEAPHYLRAPDKTDPMATVGWVLARPTRRRVLAALAQGGQLTLIQIGAATAMPVGTIDPILGVLAHVGVAQATPPRGSATGPHPIRYSINFDRVGALKAATGIDLGTVDR